ncbi:hypothetical protein O3G_MSEX002699 [Manduca sexta]|uniref:Uncharacterized protein n=1 Tax=Manduca sexta TaxID=7130 RepID=A0A921YPS9_MANSE|nr:hypothetical protein O3G_MSEX002699 [Manduca sexta]
MLKIAQTIRVMPYHIRAIERKIIDDASMRELTRFLNDPEVFKVARRSINSDKLAKARELYRILKKTVYREDDKPVLRQAIYKKTTKKPQVVDEHASIVETELKNALTHKKSALYDRPYVEKAGRNDFLVIRPDVVDPYVTVIPNAIYYNIEKKCVNWLDDCSLKGIRARLLRGVQSPYK